jgi:FKBP-type peptidyl-prolyl cis-trans isomerase (trigger factor)
MAAKRLARICSGVDLLAEVEGRGLPAAKGDRVLYNTKIRLHRGEELPLNKAQAENLPESMIRTVGQERLIDHTAVIGQREVIAGIERSLIGMKTGGYRKVRVSPHLAYREKGLPGVIPPNALLEVEIWLREIATAPINERT